MAIIIYTNGRKTLLTYPPFINPIVTEYLLYARMMVDMYFSGDLAKKPCPSKTRLACVNSTKHVQGR